MSRNKFSYLKGDELIACRAMLDEIQPGPQRDYAEELLRRFEKINDHTNFVGDVSQIPDIVDGRV